MYVCLFSSLYVFVPLNMFIQVVCVLWVCCVRVVCVRVVGVLSACCGCACCGCVVCVLWVYVLWVFCVRVAGACSVRVVLCACCVCVVGVLWVCCMRVVDMLCVCCVRVVCACLRVCLCSCCVRVCGVSVHAHCSLFVNPPTLVHASVTQRRGLVAKAAATSPAIASTLIYLYIHTPLYKSISQINLRNFPPEVLS